MTDAVADWPTFGEPPGLPSQLTKPLHPGQEERATPPRASGSKGSSHGCSIPNARWKCLLDVPHFDPKEGVGSPWELGLRLEVWKRQFLTLASTVSSEFAEYVSRNFLKAQERHDKQARGETLETLQAIQGYPMEFESRLVVVLLRVLTDDVKTPAMEADEGDEGIRSQRLLEELFLQVRPGGLEEQQTLVKFLRNLSPVGTAREAIDILRRWRLAKNRISSLALPEVPAYEQIKGILTLLKTLERRHDSLRTRLSLVRLNPDIVLGKPSGVNFLLESVEQELRRLAADETTKSNMGALEPTVAKGKGDKGSGKGLSEQRKLEERKNTLCPFMAKPGGCTFGDRCHYKHGTAHPKPKPKPKAEPKQETKRRCIFHSRKSGCKLGDRCKYLHEGPSGAAKADADQTTVQPGLVGSDAQAAKAKPKPKTKAQAKASAIASYVGMIQSGPRSSNPFPFRRLHDWDLWMCPLTEEQYQLWRDHRFLHQGAGGTAQRG